MSTFFFFLAVLGLRFCARAFPSCGERGPLLIAVRGSLTVAASLAAEHRLQTRRLSSCGARAQSLRGMWDPPGPGLEPASPALAGRFSTAAPPGKRQMSTFKCLGFLAHTCLCSVDLSHSSFVHSTDIDAPDFVLGVEDTATHLSNIHLPFLPNRILTLLK